MSTDAILAGLGAFFLVGGATTLLFMIGAANDISRRALLWLGAVAIVSVSLGAGARKISKHIAAQDECDGD